MTHSPLGGVHTQAGARLGAWQGGEIPSIYTSPEADLRALREGAGLVDLSSAGVLRLTGSDTRRFANAMFTNNVRDLPVGRGVHNALTDNKGRMQGLADTWLVAEDQLIVVLEGMPAQEAFDRLDQFIIMDPVELTDLSEEQVLLTAQGPRAAEVLRGMGAPAPEVGAARWGQCWVFANARVGGGGFDLLVPADAAIGIWAGALAAGAQGCGVLALDAIRLLAGRPRAPEDLFGRSFIHELGLRERVCSFSKGCYIGQEVINRMDTMGKINRRLMGLVAEAPGISGAELLLGEQVVGQVGSEAALDGRFLALALVRKDAWEPGTKVVARKGEAQVPARVVPLPF